MLAEEARGECRYDVVPVSRGDAQQIAANLAIGYRTPEAAHLPWVEHPYAQ